MSRMNASMSEADLVMCLGLCLNADTTALEMKTLQYPRPESLRFLDALRQVDFHKEQSLELAFPGRGRGFFRGYGPLQSHRRPRLLRSRSVPPYGLNDMWDPMSVPSPRLRSTPYGSPRLLASSSEAHIDYLHQRVNHLDEKLNHALDPPFLALPSPRSMSPAWGIGSRLPARRRTHHRLLDF